MTGVRDFQPFTESRVMYFLYINNTDGALDAMDSANKDYILENPTVEEFCDAGIVGSTFELPEFNEDS